MHSVDLYLGFSASSFSTLVLVLTGVTFFSGALSWSRTSFGAFLIFDATTDHSCEEEGATGGEIGARAGDVIAAAEECRRGVGIVNFNHPWNWRGATLSNTSNYEDMRHSRITPPPFRNLRFSSPSPVAPIWLLLCVLIVFFSGVAAFTSAHEDEGDVMWIIIFVNAEISPSTCSKESSKGTVECV